MEIDILKFSTAGSVDDGKSTLIGRLLYDSKSICADQLEAIKKASLSKGQVELDLALLTDGLRSEREQGITIDVAYRYFATKKRKFIVADTPGHIQYTRNMITGASTSNVSVILIDARHGMVEQTRRHAFIANLLGIRKVIVCINKMDLVNFSEEVFNKICLDFQKYVSRFENVASIDFIPISALSGDNVVFKSKNLTWYDGPTLLHTLETIFVTSEANNIEARFPVQYVIRPQGGMFHDFRGYAGRVFGGVFREGDEVKILGSGFLTKIKSIGQNGVRIKEAYYPFSVTMLLEDNYDISRGDMIIKQSFPPQERQTIEAIICWFSEASLNPKKRFILSHTTKQVSALFTRIWYKVDVNTLHTSLEDEVVRLNDVCRVSIRTSSPIFCDAYNKNRLTGSFIVIDEDSNETVACGMIS